MDYDNIPAYAFANSLKIPRGLGNVGVKMEECIEQNPPIQNIINQPLQGISTENPVKKQDFSDESDRSNSTYDADGNSSLLVDKMNHKPVKYMSPEERTHKLQRWRRRNLERMSRETPEQREARERRNYIHRMKLANESPEERSARLRKLREYQKERLRNETPDERERRLAKMKEYARNRTKNETSEQREERLRRGKLIMGSDKESLNCFLEETKAIWEASMHTLKHYND